MLMTCLVRMASSIRVGEQAQDHCKLAARSLAISDMRGNTGPGALALTLVLCSQVLGCYPCVDALYSSICDVRD